MASPSYEPSLHSGAPDAQSAAPTSDQSGLRRRPAAPGPRPTDASRWHVGRHHAILRDYPRVKSLFGTDPTTALWVAVLCVAQIGLAIALRHAPWWLTLAAAFAVGATLSHALGVLIHECAHNLVFRATWKNKALAIVANLPLGVPAAIEFRHQHLLHHRYLGDTREPDGGDTQAPTQREVRATGRSGWRKLLSFTFGRFVFGGRTMNKPPSDGWLTANIVACITVSLVVAFAFGPRAIVYLLVSPLLGFGPHPLGARRIAEHVTLRAAQPTSSYYGPGNLVSFDVGYHVEHHDFPFVPWSRLRRLRDLARPRYEELAVVTSWSGTLLAHFIDRRRHVGQYVGLSGDYIEADETERAQAPLA